MQFSSLPPVVQDMLLLLLMRLKPRSRAFTMLSIKRFTPAIILPGNSQKSIQLLFPILQREKHTIMSLFCICQTADTNTAPQWIFMFNTVFPSADPDCPNLLNLIYTTPLPEESPFFISKVICRQKPLVISSLKNRIC